MLQFMNDLLFRDNLLPINEPCGGGGLLDVPSISTRRPVIEIVCEPKTIQIKAQPTTKTKRCKNGLQRTTMMTMTMVVNIVPRCTVMSEMEVKEVSKWISSEKFPEHFFWSAELEGGSKIIVEICISVITLVGSIGESIMPCCVVVPSALFCIARIEHKLLI